MAVRISIDTKGSSHCSQALSIIEPKAVVHCGPGIIKYSVDTLDTHVGANNITHTRPWCHCNISIVIDRAELPLDGVSTAVSRNLR